MLIVSCHLEAKPVIAADVSLSKRAPAPGRHALGWGLITAPQLLEMAMRNAVNGLWTACSKRRNDVSNEYCRRTRQVSVNDVLYFLNQTNCYREGVSDQ